MPIAVLPSKTRNRSMDSCTTEITPRKKQHSMKHSSSLRFKIISSWTSLRSIQVSVSTNNLETKIQGLKISVKLAPGEEELIILKRTDRSGSFECSITCYFTYPEQVHMDEILKKGKKT